MLVTESGVVENRLIEVPEGVPPSALVEATNYLGARLVGRTIAEAYGVKRWWMPGMAKRQTFVIGTDGVLLDPGQPVSLAPGGIHLMLMAPPVALAAGEAVTLRLVFEGADAVEIEAPVRAVAPAAGEAAHH